MDLADKMKFDASNEYSNKWQKYEGLCQQVFEELNNVRETPSSYYKHIQAHCQEDKEDDQEASLAMLESMTGGADFKLNNNQFLKQAALDHYLDISKNDL